MTNGEKMQEMFPEGKTRRCRGGVVFESDGWCHAYDSDWWNTEHKEPTTKNDLDVDCISRKAVFETIDDCNSDGLKGIFCSYDDGERFKEYIKNLPPVTPQPTKDDLGVDCISRAEAIKCLECDFDITGEENMKTVVNYINSAHDKIVNLPRVKQEPKPMVEIDLYSVIKQKYIEREVLDKIRAEITELSHYYPMGYDYQIAITRCLEVIDKYKAESEKT